MQIAESPTSQICTDNNWPLMRKGGGQHHTNDYIYTIENMLAAWPMYLCSAAQNVFMKILYLPKCWMQT